MPAITTKTDETTIDADVEQTVENKVGEEGINEEITPSTPLDDSIGVILIHEADEDFNSHHDNHDDVDNNNETEDEPSIINLIVDMASNCEVLSIRGVVNFFFLNRFIFRFANFYWSKLLIHIVLYVYHVYVAFGDL